MPVVVYRQPWFWAVVVAVVAILGFVIAIGASSRDRTDDSSTTIVQQPSPDPNPAVVPVPTPDITPPPPAPAEPERPEEPERPARPAQPEVRERVIIKEKPVPVPVPVPSPGPSDEFQNTGLTRELRFENATWRADATVTMDESQLKSAGVAENSTELFADRSASAPFTTLYVPIPDEEGKYVRYRTRP